MKLITNDGVRIEYDDHNVSSEKSIVILSGIGGARVIWQPQIEVLVNNGYRVVNIDARNQGASEHTKLGRRMSRHAVDAAEVIEHLKLQKPYLMGNSMGAATWLAYLSIYGTQNVSGLIDVDQSPKMINTTNWHYGYKDLNWDNISRTLAAPLGKTTKHRLADDLFQKVDQAKQHFPYDEHLNFPLLVDHAIQDWRDVVINLNIPMLLVSGKESPLFNSNYVNEVVQLSNWVETNVVSDSGHLVMAEQPAIFNQIIMDFLSVH